MSIERDLGTQHGAERVHVKEMRQKAFIRLSFEKDKRGLLVRPARAFVNGTVKNRRHHPVSPPPCFAAIAAIAAIAASPPSPLHRHRRHRRHRRFTVSQFAWLSLF